MAIIFSCGFDNPDNPIWDSNVRVVQHFSGKGELYMLTESKWNTDSTLRWEVWIPNVQYPENGISPGYLYLPRTEYRLVDGFRRTRKGKYLPIVKGA